MMKNVKLCKVDFTLFLWKMCFDAISILSSAAFSKKQRRKEKKLSQFRRICCSLAKKKNQNKACGAHWRVANLFLAFENNTIMSLSL